MATKARCFVCDGEHNLRVKRFIVMGRWFHEWICRECFALPGEPVGGTWETDNDEGRVRPAVE